MNLQYQTFIAHANHRIVRFGKKGAYFKKDFVHVSICKDHESIMSINRVFIEDPITYFDEANKWTDDVNNAVNDKSLMEW